MNEEEQVGLLKEDRETLGQGVDSSDVSGLFTEKHVNLCEKRQYWARRAVAALLLICTLILITYWYRTPQPHEHSGSTRQATLRSESDYILNSKWDFTAAPTTREFSWIVADHEFNPDGVFRSMMLIDSTFPGPLIEANEDDEIVVHVHNQAMNATSIHWHGLYQNGSAHMDGTVGVTNCPIPPGQMFTYRFNITGQTGTYWYHSHLSMQASDGLVGPLVVHSRQEKGLQKVLYREDRVVLLSDHYYDPSSELLMQYLAPGSENDEPVPPSALINGRNVRNCTSLPNRSCSSTSLDNALFDLSSTESTRLRIINVGAFAEFSLQIDEHEFSVTEVDGTDVHPQATHRLNINPAQRYSIIVSPPTEPKKEGYWMRARMVTHCFAYENPELESEVWGIVRYGAPLPNHREERENRALPKPQSNDWSEIIEVECRDLNTTALEPVQVVRAPKEADDLIYLRSSFQIRDWRLSRGYLNDSSLRTDATKPMLQVLLDTRPEESGVQDASLSGFDTGRFDEKLQPVVTTRGIRTVDILIQNLDDGNHPFHLHGYKFWVLKQGKGYAPQPDSVPSLYDGIDLANPLRRDTVSIEAYGWILLRFVADNAGAWAFHCHIGWHMEAGLGMVFATRIDELADVPAEMYQQCKMDGVQKGTGPDDEVWEGTWD